MRLRLIWVLAVLLLPSAALTPTAVATADSTRGVHAITKTATPDETAKARAYWTPERMREAARNDQSTITDFPSTFNPDTASSSPPGKPRSLAEPTYSHSSRTKVDNLASPITHGRLFMYFSDHPPGQMPHPDNRSCSASVVNSGVKNTIVTAAHCVWEHTSEGGTWLKGFVFVPMYWEGTAPYGIWDYSRVTILSGFQQGDWSYDYAILNMMDTNGQKLVDVVGANGLKVNAAPPQTTVIWGYPKTDKMHPYYCDRMVTEWRTAFTLVRAWCAGVEGMSGGPWLVDYNYDIQLGYIHGVTSLVSNPPSYIISTYFNDNVAVLYNAATQP